MKAGDMVILHCPNWSDWHGVLARVDGPSSYRNSEKVRLLTKPKRDGGWGIGDLIDVPVVWLRPYDESPFASSVRSYIESAKRELGI